MISLTLNPRPLGDVFCWSVVLVGFGGVLGLCGCG